MPKDSTQLENTGQSLTLGPDQAAYARLIADFKKNDWAARFWAKDPSLWKSEPEHQKIIRNSLGWTRVAEWTLERLGDLERFAEGVKNDGFKDVVLLGMGGSSLAAEVMRLGLSGKPGYPTLHVLDSTDAGWVASVEAEIDLKKSLFIVASKSGTTVEPHCFYSYFFERAGENGAQFIAITDPGSYLEGLAKEKGFRKIFLNPSDIGGRFSALSYFGIVPAALAGLDARKMLESARRMMRACGPDVPLEENPGVQLGAAIGAAAKAGRDKATVFLPGRLETFGLWIEQLVAESSGKEGRGIVPIAGESRAQAGAYGPDRFFACVQPAFERDAQLAALAAELKKSRPVVEIELREPEDLGGEFLRWEIAISAACAALGVNAFDQPNVQEAKDQAKALLKELSEKGSLPEPPVQVRGKRFEASFSRASASAVALGDPVQAFKNFAKSLRPGEYIGLLAYLPFRAALDRKLVELRTQLGSRTRAATLFGYGPRYLHSTGQLHKGGADNGVFLLLTAEPEKDLKVPGQSYTFGQLEKAQALGDFQALDAKKRRAVRFHLQAPLDKALEEILQFVEDGLK